MNYSVQERSHAIAWKAASDSLPDEARLAAPYVGKVGRRGVTPYDFCLPPPFAVFSLLSEVRHDAVALFEELGIPWHAGIDDGPSNHLLSSQVQCVNALTQMVKDPRRIVLAFGDLVEVDEVLQIEPGRYLTFEYIGPTDFFGESPGGPRVRGAHCTSVDAAFLHRARDGVVELVLVEWKYTESYRLRRPDAERDTTRRSRYASFVADSSGPVRYDVLPFELLLDEPVYQLVRQQLLAHELEKAGAEGAGRVRVLHVLSPDNHEYQKSLHRAEHRALGDTVSEVWSKLLRSSDRFTTVNPSRFLDPEITSREYAVRYSDDAIYSQADLLRAFGLTEVADIEDVLYAEEEYDYDVVVHESGIELLAGSIGINLDYPFRESELRELAAEPEEWMDENGS